MKDVLYTFFDTEIGTIYVAATVRGICRLTFGDVDEEKFVAELTARHGSEPGRDDTLAVSMGRDFRSYLRGNRIAWTYDCDLDLLTDFRRAVLDEVRRIPFGRTETYGNIAAKLGKKGRAARAVGKAVGANPVPVLIPCHRVVGAGGDIGGFGLGLEMKRRLLEIEGIG